ncbi:MAG: Tim44 domain-containing protein [Rhodocyclaceae bacterium]|nr:Tim44 domain-containing protein [Rhodocyclaceae bacterium]MCA3025295.1 Tim44 domain-containing protein [Rhodocyclaceae bacterium]MCA3033040.1 Tim44 domain-containing protein [Rhodocyclaceae bacterium]MCA3047635.1 Tim44 domain-containing protein [Rhodocyclaceae bacterium]MCA3051149.1 Tim44 domain-containing protein [Rhodocyclaceae bacterium]
MKPLLATVVISLFTLVSLGYMSDADAKKRLGGGKSTGTQKESIQRDATPPPTKPASPAAAPAAGAAPAAAAAAPAAASGASKWLGPLAGLAAGGLLAAMFMGGAFDGLKFFDILLMIGLAVAAFMLVRMFMRKKAAEMGGMNAPASGNSQYAGAGAPYTPEPSPPPVSAAPATTTNRIAAPEIGSRLSTANASSDVINEATAKPRIPADFDVIPFERNSKAAFIRLQAANDAKDLNDIREFTTPEMYGELALQIQERGTAAQKTEVVSVDARVIEVVIENNRAVASVRYTGVIREDDGQAEGFDEVWHVSKDLSDEQSTWRLAGIQQLG